MRARRDTHAWVALLFVAVGLVILWALPHRISGDGEPRFETVEHLFATGHLKSARYSTVMPLLSAPLYLVGRAVGYAREVTALFNPLIFSLGLWALARELRDEMDAGDRRAALVLFVYASMFANHVQAFYGEVFTALATAIGVFWLARGLGKRGWALILAGAVNTPGMLFAVAAIALRRAWQTRRWGPLLMPGIAFALTRCEAFLVRGSLFTTGYEGDVGFKTALPYSGKPGFSYPLFLGILSILFSFGKGLVFFAPGLLVPIAPQASPRLRWVHGTLLAAVVGLVFGYAKWWAWYGGTFWGPRFFLLASVPACLALATWLGPREARAGVSLQVGLLVAGFLSFWGGVNGLIFDQTGLGLCTQDNYALESFCLYVPEMSVLWHPFVDFASAVPAKTRSAALGVCAWWAVVACWTLRHVLFDLAVAARTWGLVTVSRASRGRSNS